MLQSGTRWLCAREIQNSLKDSVKQLLELKINQFNLSGSFQIKNTEIVTPGGGLLSFHGLQNHTTDSIKSLEGYHGTWVEEAQSVSQRSLDLLIPTIRAKNAEYWFSWNPYDKDDPVEKLLRSDPPIPHSIVVKANYLDNPWFYTDTSLVTKVEWDQKTDPDKYAHVWLGEYQRLSETRVFKNWIKQDVPEPPPGTRFYYGADWGFSVDPSVLVRCWFNGRTMYVDREAYAKHCEIEFTPALFDKIENGQARQWPVIADSARPETISYMQRHGYDKMRPAKKGAGSIEEGVTFLQNYQIIVDPSCKNCLDELARYSYKTDKHTGEILPQLEDKKNHVIDALRYAVETLRTFKDSVATVGAKSPRQTDWQREYFRR